MRRLAGAVLGPVFGLLLLIPLVRRYRRRPGWNWIRLLGLAIGLALLAAGQGHPGVLAAGAVFLLLAIVWGPLEDPDRMRKLAQELGASHAVNGGFYCGGSLDLPPGTALQFFLSNEELLVVADRRPEKILGRFNLASIEVIQADGQNYQPQYVSFAKAPPQRDEHLDPNACCRLTLRFTPPASWLEIEYRGVFSRHLAEVASHTLHECRAAQRSAAASLPLLR